MAKDFTRNVDNVKDIKTHKNEYTNTNDLLSDNTHNYIHKPDGSFHCLTDNIKTIKTDNSDILIIENDNKNNESKININLPKNYFENVSYFEDIIDEVNHNQIFTFENTKKDNPQYQEMDIFYNGKKLLTVNNVVERQVSMIVSTDYYELFVRININEITVDISKNSNSMDVSFDTLHNDLKKINITCKAYNILEHTFRILSEIDYREGHV